MVLIVKAMERFRYFLFKQTSCRREQLQCRKERTGKSASEAGLYP